MSTAAHHDHHETASAGHTLRLLTTTLEPGRSRLRFQVLDAEGRPVTGYTPIHDRELHLIVVRRELTGFWHLHPEREDDGTWTVGLDLPDPGAYRVFADLAPQPLGSPLTLSADLTIAGDPEPQRLPEAGRTFTVDGREVTLSGDLVGGTGQPITLTVRRDGVPVTDLEPYLAAYGHLVVLRADDLAYVHVHPDGEPGDGVTRPGPDITFHAAVPGPGTYRLFLDFKHDGTVRTASFTLQAR